MQRRQQILIDQLTEARDTLQRLLEEEEMSQQQRANAGASLALVEHALAAASEGDVPGECRLSTPYAPVRPVIDESGGLMWCCTHDPEHCVNVGE